MKRIILFTGLLVSFLFCDAQKSISRDRVKKMPAHYDSTKLSKERLKLLSEYQQTARRERNNILLFPTADSARYNEVLYIGKLEKKEVYKVDLTAIVSKYIGETEKNLEQVFAEAASKQWILLFDEADALFGKTKDPESVINSLQALSQSKNVLAIFWCEDDCLKRWKKARYVLLQ